MLEQHKAAVKKIKDLDAAIKNKKYEVVKALLNDPLVAVNFGFSEAPLPLSVMYATGDTKIARLFLECERIDWLAPIWDRSMRNVKEEFGIHYGHDEEAMNQQKKIKSMIDYLYLLDSKFISKCPQEAKLIYERIFAEIAKGLDKSEHKQLLFKSVNCWNAFQVALKYFDDIFVKDSSGKSLLHLTNSITISTFLVSKGLDPNALDDSDWTPLMCRLNYANLESCIALASLGANTTFVNKHGQSALQSDHCLEYLNNFDVTEEMFLGALTYAKSSHNRHWDHRNLYRLFDFYPHFRAIFESNLPVNLASIDQSTYLIKFYNMTDEEYVLYLKNIIEDDYKYRLIERKNYRSLYYDTFEERLNIIIDETKRPLKQAEFDELCEYFKNTPVNQKVEQQPVEIDENKPILFKANRYETVNLIVRENVDYSVEYNGLKFFEREEFESKLYYEDTEWLIALYEKGVDLFTPGKASGKSLIGHLNPERELEVKYENSLFLFPIAKLSKFFFEACKAGLKFNAILDEEENTVLHYLCSQRVKVVIGELSFEYLKSKMNNSGKSPFDFLIENDKYFAFGRTIMNEYKLKQYMQSFIDFHGSAYFFDSAPQLLLNCLEYGYVTFARILIQKYNVSLYSIIYCAKKSKLRSLRDIYQDTYSKKVESYVFAVNNGYQVTKDEFKTSLQTPFATTILNLCEDPYQYVIETCKDPEVFRKKEVFFSHPRFMNCPAPGAKNGCTVLEQHFFSICLTRELYDLFKELGANPRKLIGSGLQAKIDPDLKRNFFTLLNCLLEDGWTKRDLRKIIVRNCHTLDDYARTDLDYAFRNLIPNFYRIHEKVPDEYIGKTCAACNNKFEKFEFTAELRCQHLFHLDCIQLRHSSKESICCICPNWIERKSFAPDNLDEILGDKESCALCRQDFEEKEVLGLLKCKHWFHIDCIEKFAQTKVCPYCRTEHE